MKMDNSMDAMGCHRALYMLIEKQVENKIEK